MFGPLDREADNQLQDHLRACPECARRMDTYRRIRDEMPDMEPVALPEELHELLAQGLDDALAGKAPVEGPPAVPTPERPASQKALIFIGGVLALMAVTVCLLLVFRGEYESPPTMGDVDSSFGTVQISTPGSARWRDLVGREFLPPGVRLRTGPDSLLKLQGAGVSWWLAGMSSVALTDPGTAELMVGRMYARCDAGAEEPVRLVTANGILSCPGGEFVASISMKRLRVACISGAVFIEGPEDKTQLEEGQAAMVVEGELAGPIRSVRTAELTHWLKVFDSYDGRHLSFRQLASVRLASAPAVLPSWVSLESLTITARVRGPLALVRLQVELRNNGSEPWRGALRAGDLLLPAPLAQAGTGAVALEPGQAGSYETVGVCLMRARSGFFGLGVTPRVWTSNDIGRLQLDVDASAEGGLKEFACLAMNCRVKRQKTVRQSWVGHGVNPLRPVVLEFAFAERDGVDALWLATEADAWALTAWRPEPDDDEWIKKGRSVFVAFDASADFGAGRRRFAHEVMEVLLSSFPPGCSTVLMAYDGKVRRDPDPLTRHLPARVEAMLVGLWDLQEGAESRTADFLKWALVWAAAAGGEGLLVFVTGRDEVGALDEAQWAPPDDRIRIALLQVGADEPAQGYRELCARWGGVALALPDFMAPELAALDFLANLRWPALAEVAVETEAGAKPRLLTARGDFANQPVAALVPVTRPGGKVIGRFSARAGGRQLARRFELDMPDGSAAVSATADEILAGLKRRALQP